MSVVHFLGEKTDSKQVRDLSKSQVSEQGQIRPGTQVPLISSFQYFGLPRKLPGISPFNFHSIMLWNGDNICLNCFIDSSRIRLNISVQLDNNVLWVLGLGSLHVQSTLHSRSLSPDSAHLPSQLLPSQASLSLVVYRIPVTALISTNNSHTALTTIRNELLYFFRCYYLVYHSGF